MQSIVARVSVFVLVLACLAPPTSAGDPAGKAFRAAAKAASKDLRLETNARVADVKAALADALAAYSGDGDLAAAVEAGVDAVSRALARNATSALAAAEALSSEGAALLLDAAGDVPADFRDGGGGAWDDFKVDAGAQLAKVDAKLGSLFGGFVKTLTKASLKSDDHDPDVRWSLRGHHDLLEPVVGPLLGAAGATVGVKEQRAQILLDVRLVTTGGELLTTIGVDFRGDMGTLDVLDSAGTLSQATGLTPDEDSLLVASLNMEFGVTGPVRIVFRDDADQPLSTATGSAPTWSTSPKTLEKAFKLRLSKELGFIGKEIKGQTKGCAQGLAALAKDHAQGDLGTLEAVEQGLSSWRQALGGDLFWIDLVMGNPVHQTEADFQAAGLSDADVGATFMPDGQGDCTRFLGRLERKITTGLAARDKLLAGFLAKIGKQGEKSGEETSLAFTTRAPRPLRAPVFDVDLDVPALEDEVQVLAGVLARSDAGGDVGLGAFYAGIARDGLPLGMTSLSAYLGDTVDLTGLTSQASGAFEVGVPTLGDVPVLGWLFRSANDEPARASVMVLVTPRVVDPADL